jgi:hypothetical protein
MKRRVSALVQSARHEVKVGKFIEAVSDMNAAYELKKDAVTAEDWNLLCWFGSAPYWSSARRRPVACTRPPWRTLLPQPGFSSPPRGQACQRDGDDDCALYPQRPLCPCTRCAKIVGPTFSGSAASMRFAIDQWAKSEPGVSVRIVTGSANGDALVPTFRSLGSHEGSVTGGVEFASTVPSAEAQECGYYSFLRERLGVDALASVLPGDKRRVLQGVALLHESGTNSGQPRRHTAISKPRSTFRFPFTSRR